MSFETYLEGLAKEENVQRKLDNHLTGLVKQASQEAEVEAFLSKATAEELAKMAGITLPEDTCPKCAGTMQKLGSILQCSCGRVKKAQIGMLNPAIRGARRAALATGTRGSRMAARGAQTTEQAAAPLLTGSTAGPLSASELASVQGPLGRLGSKVKGMFGGGAPTPAPAQVPAFAKGAGVGEFVLPGLVGAGMGALTSGEGNRLRGALAGGALGGAGGMVAGRLLTKPMLRTMGFSQPTRALSRLQKGSPSIVEDIGAMAETPSGVRKILQGAGLGVGGTLGAAGAGGLAGGLGTRAISGPPEKDKKASLTKVAQAYRESDKDPGSTLEKLASEGYSDVDFDLRALCASGGEVGNMAQKLASAASPSHELGSVSPEQLMQVGDSAGRLMTKTALFTGMVAGGLHGAKKNRGGEGTAWGALGGLGGGLAAGTAMRLMGVRPGLGRLAAGMTASGLGGHHLAKAMMKNKGKLVEEKAKTSAALTKTALFTGMVTGGLHGSKKNRTGAGVGWGALGGLGAALATDLATYKAGLPLPARLGLGMLGSGLGGHYMAKHMLKDKGRPVKKKTAAIGEASLTPEELQEAVQAAKEREDIPGRAGRWGVGGAALGGTAGGLLGAGAGLGARSLMGGRGGIIAPALGTLAGSAGGAFLGHRLGRAEGAEEAAADKLVSALRAQRAYQAGGMRGFMAGRGMGNP